ncbi:MAG: phosphatase PAP2 family protein [Bacteroidetes bacterium QS_9_68_14]|nr:MAG: phosphatase PAP2 family protein [Bacteroidetes bacterium QS_9_68_14]
MRTADAVAYPLFYGAVPVAWGAALLRGTGYDDAYRLALTGGLALGAALGLKRAVGRARPYRTLPAVQSRSEAYRRGQEGHFAEAFPSGHATAAFALATSWSLSHPESYVAGPAFAGATLIGASRLWLGVHYPSDVLAGALLGAGVAVAVHLLRGAVTPGAMAADDSSGHAAAAPHRPTVRLRLPLP